jgi:hypothetical protein
MSLPLCFFKFVIIVLSICLALQNVKIRFATNILPRVSKTFSRSKGRTKMKVIEDGRRGDVELRIKKEESSVQYCPKRGFVIGTHHVAVLLGY